MTRLLKLTTFTLMVMTPMAASADYVLTQTNPLRQVIQVTEPPLLIEIVVPGPPPVREIAIQSVAVGR